MNSSDTASNLEYCILRFNNVSKLLYIFVVFQYYFIPSVILTNTPSNNTVELKKKKKWIV